MIKDGIALEAKKMVQIVNETIEEEVDCCAGDLKVVKFDLESLVADFVIEVLGSMGVSDYVTCMDIEDGKLICELNSKRIEIEHRIQEREWEQERNDLMQEYFNSRGVY